MNSEVSMLKKIMYILSSKLKSLFVIFLVFTFSSISDLLSISIIFPYVILLQDTKLIDKYAILRQIFDRLSLKSDTSIIIAASILLIFIYLLKNITVYFTQYGIYYYTYNIQIYLREKLFKAYLHAPYKFYLKQNSATLLTNINDEVFKFSNGVVLSIITLFSESIFITLAITALVIYN
ncbi:MAG: ABC transporter transmembrane domain-containing protein, partial [Actinobacteria bacterium]|nr:ABC transporter transmembrane domain-containing protein [Actinomycetota bacterium]